MGSDPISRDLLLFKSRSNKIFFFGGGGGVLSWESWKVEKPFHQNNNNVSSEKEL